MSRPVSPPDAWRHHRQGQLQSLGKSSQKTARSRARGFLAGPIGGVTTYRVLRRPDRRYRVRVHGSVGAGRQEPNRPPVVRPADRLVQPATDTSNSLGRSRIEKALGALILASCLIVPLLFTLAQRDAFALIKVTVLQIVAVVGILLLGVRRFWWGDRTRVSAPVTNIAMFVLVALNLTACILSMHPLRSLTGEELQHQGFLSLLVYVSFFYISHIALVDERRTVGLFSSIALGGTLVAVYALIQAARLDPIWPYPAFGRTFSTIGQPNGLAAYLVVVAPVTAALLPRMQTTTARALVVLGAGLMGAAVLSTKSRGGYLGFVASSLTLAWPLARSLRLRPRSLLAALVLLTMVGLVLSPVRDTMTVAWRRSIYEAQT